MPTISLEGQKLKILKIKEGIDFKKDVVLSLYSPNEDIPIVKLDWYPKVQILQSSRNRETKGEIAQEENKLTKNNLAFINWEQVFFEVQKFKNERSWYNISIGFDNLKELFVEDDWYCLYVPTEELSLKEFEQTYVWQEIVISLVKNYIDKVYNHEKNKYLSKYLITEILDPTHPNFIEKYHFFIDKSREDIIEKIKFLKELVESNQFKENYSFGINSEVFEFSQHLYKPLVSCQIYYDV